MVTTPMAWNEHQVDELFALADDLGIALRFQGPVAPRDDGDTGPLVIQPRRETWDRIETLVTERDAQAMAGPVQHHATEVSVEREAETPASRGVGVAGVDIDPYGNVQACKLPPESAGHPHEQSIERIWRHAPLFTRARQRAIEAAERLEVQERVEGERPRQLNAPLFRLAAEEKRGKGRGAGGRGR
jgi:MoaA/NifB/PqqE/SkfB family radical SAM enzyme